MMETGTTPSTATAERSPEQHINTLVADVEQNASAQGLQLLMREPDQIIAEVLLRLSYAQALKILARFRKNRKAAILALLPQGPREQWAMNLNFPMSTVGRLMEKPVGLFRPEVTVREAVDLLRVMVKEAFITYGYVTDAQGTLLGVLVMRDVLLADPAQRVADIMIRDPFFLTPRASVSEAVRAVWNKHYPVYPVCNEEGALVGLVRGYVLFEEQNTRISAQAGRMVGVGEEARLATPWWSSF
jgi:magnesium transporter